MPQAPRIDGLPIWLQITLSVIFAIVTLVVAAKGYQSGPKPNITEPSATIAHLADMSAVRSLTDAVHQLHAEVTMMCMLLRDQTHFTRDNIDVSREMCQRLRELREILEKTPRL